MLANDWQVWSNMISWPIVIKNIDKKKTALYWKQHNRSFEKVTIMFKLLLLLLSILFYYEETCEQTRSAWVSPRQFCCCWSRSIKIRIRNKYEEKGVDIQPAFSIKRISCTTKYYFKIILYIWCMNGRMDEYIYPPFLKNYQ